MLHHPELVGDPPNRHEADDDVPQQDGPGAEAVLDHGHGVQLELDKVGAHPLGPEVEAVDGAGDEHCAGHPAVQPVETLMAGADEKPDDVDFGGEEEEHRELGEGDPGVAVADALPEVDVVDDGAPGHEVDDDGPVAEQDEDAAEGRGCEPGEVAEGDEELGMADFADHGGCGGPGLGEGAIGTGWMGG